MQQIILLFKILLTMALVVKGHTGGAAVTVTTTATNDVDVVVEPNFRHQGTQSSSSSSKYGSPQCISEGRLADPDNCDQYYDCLSSHNGRFVARQQSCFGHAFHPTMRACVPWQMVKGCVPSDTSISIRSIYAVDPNVQELCSNPEHHFLCIDCLTLAICIEGKPHFQPCDHGCVCSMKMKEIFNGGVCFPGNPVKCTCNEANILKQDLYNPSKFLSCGIEGTDPTIHSCPGELIFSEQHRACRRDIDSACTESGIFLIKADCTRYYICISTTEGWFHKEYTCKNNTMFNEKKSKCEDPCDWHSGNFTCEEKGRFANPFDCTKYYVCIAKPMNSDNLISVEQKCPEGYEWRQMVNNCVPRVTAKKICHRPVKPNECTVPDEWCTAAVCSPKCLNGNCTSPNICNCDEGWTGNQCQTFVCRPNCTNGECIGPNICSCTAEWTGNLCQIPVCRPKCLYGNCTGPNICNCDEGWTGKHCQNSMCSPICLYGNCTGPNICNCDEGWTGNHCQTSMCSPMCLNGKCAGTNICNCDEGWTGSHCQTPVCSPNCTNGECTGPNICNCTTSWTGSLCQTRECPEGFITTNGSSQCFKFFNDKKRNWDDAVSTCLSEGLQLAEPSDEIAVMLREDLYNTYAGDGHVWLGARGDGVYIRWQSNNEYIINTNSLWYPGHPRTDTTSLCLEMLLDEDYLKRTPTQPYASSTCDYLQFTLCESVWCSPECLNGNCTAPNICSCNEGWTGSHCQIPVCSPNCTNGECIGPNICNCTTGWTGNLCGNRECPVGSFELSGSSECFKFIDVSGNYDSAKARCQSEGLQVAEPSDGVAVMLRTYIYETYGNGKHTWIGAVGDGTYIRWESNNEILMNSNQLWYPGRPNSFVPTVCVIMLISVSNINEHPTTPYYTTDCSTTADRYTLCESVWCNPECLNGNCTAPNICSCDEGWTGNHCQSRCPEGLFMLQGGTQCFKYFDDQKRNWDDANTKCQEEGYELAKPQDPLALRKYIAEQDPALEPWIGARGDGEYMVWQRDNVKILSTDPYWWPGEENNVLTTHCMGLQALKSSLEARPDKPYSAWPCSELYYQICELVIE